jgi:hypothetical protein
MIHHTGSKAPAGRNIGNIKLPLNILAPAGRNWGIFCE